jgi:uncharacterized membrane protein YphA (DoxX/SURF4 family)
MKRLIYTFAIPSILPRIIVGFIFLSEGIQKFIRPDDVGIGRFAKIGFSHAAFWAHFTGSCEITGSILILLGLFTRLAAMPLFIIMIVAFITTKYPILIDKGFWVMAHEYRTDFAITLLLVFLLIYGGGKSSLDLKVYNSENK